MNSHAAGGGVRKQPWRHGQKFPKNCGAACDSSIESGMDAMSSPRRRSPVYRQDQRELLNHV